MLLPIGVPRVVRVGAPGAGASHAVGGGGASASGASGAAAAAGAGGVLAPGDGAASANGPRPASTSPPRHAVLAVRVDRRQRWVAVVTAEPRLHVMRWSGAASCSGWTLLGHAPIPDAYTVAHVPGTHGGSDAAHWDGVGAAQRAQRVVLAWGEASTAEGFNSSRVVVWLGLPESPVHVFSVDEVKAGSGSAGDTQLVHTLPLPAWMPEAAAATSPPTRVTIAHVADVSVCVKVHPVADGDGTGGGGAPRHRLLVPAVTAAGADHPQRVVPLACVAAYKRTLFAVTRDDNRVVRLPWLRPPPLASAGWSRGSKVAADDGSTVVDLGGADSDASPALFIESLLGDAAASEGDTTPGATRSPVSQIVVCEALRVMGVVFADGRSGIAAAASRLGSCVGRGGWIDTSTLSAPVAGEDSAQQVRERLRSRGGSGDGPGDGVFRGESTLGAGSAASGASEALDAEGADAPPRVSCIAFSAAAASAAVGTTDGDVRVLSVDVAAHRTRPRQSRVRARVQHVFSLAPWDFAATHTGAVNCLSWAPCGTGVAAGYARRGLVVWGSYGVRLASTLPAAGNGVQRKPGEPMCHGVRDLAWTGDGLQLVAVPFDAPRSQHAARAGSVDAGDASAQERAALTRVVPVIGAHQMCHIAFVRDASTSASALVASGSGGSQGEGGPLLLGARSAYTFSNPGADATLFRWVPLPAPPMYTGSNAPLQSLAASEEGDKVAVAGRRGLAVWTASPPPSGKWRLFGNVEQERVLCPHGLLWWTPRLVLVLHREVIRNVDPVSASGGDRDDAGVVAAAEPGAAIPAPRIRRHGEGTVTSDGYSSDVSDDDAHDDRSAGGSTSSRRKCAVFYLIAFPHTHLDDSSIKLWKPLPPGLEPICLAREGLGDSGIASTRMTGPAPTSSGASDILAIVARRCGVPPDPALVEEHETLSVDSGRAVAGSPLLRLSGGAGVSDGDDTHAPHAATAAGASMYLLLYALVRPASESASSTEGRSGDAVCISSVRFRSDAPARAVLALPRLLSADGGTADPIFYGGATSLNGEDEATTPPPFSPPQRWAVLTSDGRLWLLDLRASARTQTLLAERVDHMWATREGAFYGRTGVRLLFVYGRDGLRVWVPHMDPDGATLRPVSATATIGATTTSESGAGADADLTAPAAPLSSPYDPVTSFDVEVQPLGVHPRLGALLGARQDAHYASPNMLPCFEPLAELEPCLHAVVRAYLRAGGCEAGAQGLKEAAQLCARAGACRLPGFARSLERLVFGALEEAAASATSSSSAHASAVGVGAAAARSSLSGRAMVRGSSDRSDGEASEGAQLLARVSAPALAYLRAVIGLVAKFPQYPQIVALAGRKSERSRLPLLFHVAGSPLVLFRKCLRDAAIGRAAGGGHTQLRTATQHMLLVQDWVAEGGHWEPASDVGAGVEEVVVVDDGDAGDADAASALGGHSGVSGPATAALRGAPRTASGGRLLRAGSASRVIDAISHAQDIVHVPEAMVASFECATELLGAALAAGQLDIAADVVRFVSFRMTSGSVHGVSSPGRRTDGPHAAAQGSSGVNPPLVTLGTPAPRTPAPAPALMRSPDDAATTPPPRAADTDAGDADAGAEAGASGDGAGGWGLGGLLWGVVSVFTPERPAQAPVAQSAPPVVAGRRAATDPPRSPSADVGTATVGRAAAADSGRFAVPPRPPTTLSDRERATAAAQARSSSSRRRLQLAELDALAGGGSAALARVGDGAGYGTAGAVSDDPAYLGGFLEAVFDDHMADAMARCDVSAVAAAMWAVPLRCTPVEGDAIAAAVDDPAVAEGSDALAAAAAAAAGAASDADNVSRGERPPASVVSVTFRAPERGSTVRPFAGFGIALSPSNPTFLTGASVDAVRSGGAADDTGAVSEGDELVAINGERFEGRSVDHIIAAMRRAGEVLARGGGPFQLEFWRPAALRAEAPTSLRRVVYEMHVRLRQYNNALAASGAGFGGGLSGAGSGGGGDARLAATAAAASAAARARRGSGASSRAPGSKPVGGVAHEALCMVLRRLWPSAQPSSSHVGHAGSAVAVTWCLAAAVVCGLPHVAAHLLHVHRDSAAARQCRTLASAFSSNSGIPATVRAAYEALSAQERAGGVVAATHAASSDADRPTVAVP